jgi:DNA-binding beta-propeller fold protein YncE
MPRITPRNSPGATAGTTPGGRAGPRARAARVALTIAGSAVGLAVTVVLVLVGVAAAGLSRPAEPVVAPLRTPFEGGHLLVASDVDMVGTAYADGVLRQLPGERDALTVVELPWDGSAGAATALTVPNAVTSWPDVVAAAPGGERAYVVETDAAPPPGTERLAVTDFPPGSRLTVVDLAADRPQVLDEVRIGERPLTLDVSPDGSLLAVGFPGGRVGLFPTGDLAAGDTVTLRSAAGEPVAEAASVTWHPSGEFLAVGLGLGEVTLHRVARDTGGAVALTRHGAPLVTGDTLAAGRFTPDGDHYVTTDIRWDTVPRPLGQLVNPRGRLLVTEVDVSPAAAHRVTARVPVGQSPEGITLSPDGRFAVTVDMRRTYLPGSLAWWPGTGTNQLTLVELAPDGSAELRGEYAFDGVLPEDAVVDVAGDTVAVTVFHDREAEPRTGRVELWNLVTDDGPARLEATAAALETPRGPHSLWATP